MIDQFSNLAHFDNRYKILSLVDDFKKCRVYLAIETSTHRKVALKVYSSDEFEKYDPAIEVMHELRHPNIITVLRQIQDQQYHAYSMPYIPSGDLYFQLQNDFKFTMETMLNAVYCLCSVVRHMHELRYVHGNIRLENILVKETSNGPEFFLTGFSYARKDFISIVDRDLVDIYIPNEARLKRTLTAKSDVYALGHVFYFMMDTISVDGLDQEGENDLNLLKQLISSMITDEESERYNINECLTHPYTTKFYNNSKPTLLIEAQSMFLALDSVFGDADLYIP